MSNLPRRSFLRLAATSTALTTSTMSVSDPSRSPLQFYTGRSTKADVGVALEGLEDVLAVEDELTVRATRVGDGESFVEVIAYLDGGNITYGLTPADARQFAENVAEAARFVEGGQDA